MTLPGRAPTLCAMDVLSYLQLDRFESGDPLAVAVVILLACLLSCDNAVVLALLVRDLPRAQQGRALSYGLIGAYIFRIVALICAVWIMSKWYLKLAGGIYLLYLAIAHFARGERPHGPRAARRLLGLDVFWSTVIIVELADVVFSIDSIAASIVVTQKLWVLIFGSAIGMVAMRFAAKGFVILLARFPGLEAAAFAAVGAVGLQLLLELPVDVLGRLRAAPTTPYATAAEWRAAVDADGGHAFAIGETVVVNLDAPPPPEIRTMRKAQDLGLRETRPELGEAERGRLADEAATRELRLAHAWWSLSYRPFIDIQGWVTSIGIITIFACGFLVRRRAPHGSASAPSA